MSVPSPWVNSDYVSFDIRVEAVMDNTVLIPVPCKILKKWFTINITMTPSGE